MGSQLPLKGAHPPVFGSCLLWPNGWMDEDATWNGSRPRSRPLCIRRVPCSHPRVTDGRTDGLMERQTDGIAVASTALAMRRAVRKRFALCYQTVVCLFCFVCLSVTLVYRGNAWMDQYETWLAGRPRPSPNCVKWRPSSPSP